MEHSNLDSCIEEWSTLSNEYISLEKHHKNYEKRLTEVSSMQHQCSKGITHQRYRLNIIKNSLKTLEKSSEMNTREGRERMEMLQTDLIRRKAQLYEMENILPKQNGTYLKIILGNCNVSILDKSDKFRYKNEYEKFKLVMSLIALAVSLFNSLTNYRTMDIIHMFLLVWYYCTLTIRESILKVNGSRIKGWWRAHHFISTVLAGVMLVWPVGECYYTFRNQFMYFNVYISIVQYLQFVYQKGILYRLKSLGESPKMEVTVDGFTSWMWKGLSFLLPFLYIGYLWEGYHAYTLWHLSSLPSADWHVSAVGLLFFVLFSGNCYCTTAVIPEKLKDRFKLKYRFTKLDKYIWTHKKRSVSFRNPDVCSKRTVSGSGALAAPQEVVTDSGFVSEGVRRRNVPDHAQTDTEQRAVHVTSLQHGEEVDNTTAQQVKGPETASDGAPKLSGQDEAFAFVEKMNEKVVLAADESPETAVLGENGDEEESHLLGEAKEPKECAVSASDEAFIKSDGIDLVEATRDCSQNEADSSGFEDGTSSSSQLASESFIADITTTPDDCTRTQTTPSELNITLSDEIDVEQVGATSTDVENSFSDPDATADKKC